MNSNTKDEDGLMGLQAQLEAFRRSDAQRDSLLQRIVNEYRLLDERYREVLGDLDNEKASRRYWQSEHSTARQELQTIQQRTEGSPFVLAVIDGDGTIFQEKSLRAGAAGGSEAAHQLVSEIKNHLKKVPDASTHWPIVAHIYANFEGLSKKLTQVGICKSPNDLHAFACAFSFHQPLFSFIDVGRGKERADHKIKEMFRLFIANSHCKHILFGGCHDNGYLPNLESYRRDESVSYRMTLLASTPPEPGFRHTNIPIIRFESLFRTEPLPEARLPPDDATSSQTMPIQPPLFMTGHQSTLADGFQNGSTSENSSPKQSNVAKPAVPAPLPASTTSAAVQPLTGSSNQPSAPSTYAAIGRNNSEAKEFSIVANKPAPPKKVVYVNSDGCRIDAPIQRPDQAVWQALSNRIKQQKVCNHFHLMGKCKNGNSCYYAHEPRLNQKEQMALRSRARTTPCPNGSECRDVDCYLGHVCPTEDCQHYDCRFGDLHNLDNTIRTKIFEDGYEETVH